MESFFAIIEIVSRILQFLNLHEINPMVLLLLICLLLVFVIFRFSKFFCYKSRHKKIKNNCNKGRSILQELVEERWPYGIEMKLYDEGNCHIPNVLKEKAAEWQKNSIKSLATTQQDGFEKLPNGRMPRDTNSIAYYEKLCKQKLEYLQAMLLEIKSKIDNYKFFYFS